MNPTTAALRAGWNRGLIELRQSFTNSQDLFGQLFWPVAMLATMFFMRNSTFGNSGLHLGTLLLPGVLGMNLAFTGLIAMAQLLAVEREDGTLLRAKATPNGMLGYLVGKIVAVSGGLLAGLAIVLIPGIFVVRGIALNTPGAWLTLIWVVALGMVATLPMGAVLGTLFTSPRSLGLVTLPLFGVVAISGIFYPITSMPGWLQAIGQVFPIYWLGLGMRSALLPGGAVNVEIDQSWRHLESLGVLGTWAVLGLILAPMLLRRMARRESGTSVAQRRERAMQRVG